MVERAAGAEAALHGPHGAALQAEITGAFRAAFLLIAAFTAANFLLAIGASDAADLSATPSAAPP